MRSDRECWLGLWWSNGAPLGSQAQALEGVDVPDNVTNLIVVGQAVAVPWSEIHVYLAQLDPHTADPLPSPQVASTVDDQLAARVLERHEASSGLRCTLLRAPGDNVARLLRRDGTRRVFPFNLLFDSDPRSTAGPTRSPSPVQDVQLTE